MNMTIVMHTKNRATSCRSFSRIVRLSVIALGSYSQRNLNPVDTVQSLRAFADQGLHKSEIQGGSDLITIETRERGRRIPDRTNLKQVGMIGQITQQPAES